MWCIIVAFLATIICDFDDDWCDFAVTATGDGPSTQGFKWSRRTSNNIKTNTFEGPEQGTIVINISYFG